MGLLFKQFKKIIWLCCLFAPLAVFASVTDGTIDATYKYAWGENIGWIDFSTTTGNVHVTDSGLSGYALSETVGWIYLGDISNDGAGNLSGTAWSENAGWIKFNPTNGGVIINSSGEFTGSALSENVGWIIFDGDYTAKTDWRPRSARPACNNATDDDGDGLIDYPNDTGCSSLTDTDETAPSSGGGMPASAYNLPSPPSVSPTNPSGSFRVLINNGVKFVNSRVVSLKMIAGADSKRMAVADNAEMQGGSGQIAFTESYNWDLCYLKNDCPDGEYAVYARFYTEHGQPSETVMDKIILDTVAPKIEWTHKEDFYSSGESITLSGKTEPKAEIVLHWDKKYGLITANAQGNFQLKLGELASGVYYLEMRVTDMAGNKSSVATFDLNVIGGLLPEKTAEEPETEIKKPVIQKIGETIESLVPEFLKPKKAEEKPEQEMIVIPEDAPIALGGSWNLMSQTVEKFALAPLPSKIASLAQKFPEFEKTLAEIGIDKLTDVSRLQNIKMKLPGLSKSIASAVDLETEDEGIPKADLKTIKFDVFKGLPLAKLPTHAKKEIPDSIVFARSGYTDGEKVIDYDIALNFDEKGNPEQKITTLSNSPLRLVIRPENPVKGINGYIVLKPKIEKSVSVKENFKLVQIIKNWLTNSAFAQSDKEDDFNLQKLTSSLMFENPNFVKDYQDIPLIYVEGASGLDAGAGRVAGVSTALGETSVESRFVLLKFKYTDLDGDGIYTANIQAPAVNGEYEIITVMDFEDPKLGKKEIRLITVVDPEGYIYERDGAKETRIPGAIVSIFWMNPEKKQYELWQAENYSQENPQVTDTTGKYSFLVPEGSYHLKIETPGYLDYDGKPFQVKEGSGVHINIEVKTKYWWFKIVDWKTALLVLVIILLLYNFYRDKIRERIGKKFK